MYAARQLCFVCDAKEMLGRYLSGGERGEEAEGGGGGGASAGRDHVQEVTPFQSNLSLLVYVMHGSDN